MEAIAPSPGLLRFAVALAAASVLVHAAFAGLLGAVLGSEACAGGEQTNPSADADRAIPAVYLVAYRRAGSEFGIPWQLLAAIGAVESDHGRSNAPGVRSGVNSYGCCAGPMQFNLTNGPPSTWQTYRVDGDADGDMSPYDAADAIASAARYLSVLLDGARGDIARAVFGYNHSSAYVEDVLARTRAYGSESDASLLAPAPEACAGAGAGSGPANLQAAERRYTPRAYVMLPAWAMAGGRPTQPIDARLLDNALWILRNYRLRVTAARERGHNTHGDGTALDLVPAEPVDQEAWDASAGALARDVGWTPACGRSGTRPACDLVPAIQFVGYEGYRNHGSPRTCSGACPAHLHVSWVSPCYGTAAPSAPCEWITAFATDPAAAPRAAGGR